LSAVRETVRAELKVKGSKSNDAKKVLHIDGACALQTVEAQRGDCVSRKARPRGARHPQATGAAIHRKPGDVRRTAPPVIPKAATWQVEGRHCDCPQVDRLKYPIFPCTTGYLKMHLSFLLVF
jgi:hypothetical protein